MKPTIFLIRNVAPHLYGGGESYQLELAKVLTAQGFHPVIITASTKLLQNAQKMHITTIKSPYIKQQNWSGWRNLLLPMYIIWQFRLYLWYRKQIKKYHPIALDIQSRDEWIAATLAGKHANTKILWTDHIDFRTWVFQNVNIKGKNFIGKYIVKLTALPSKIIAISDFEANWLSKHVRELDNLIVIKNGVIDQKQSYLNIKSVPKSFSYVGRIIEYKGIKELIQAFNIVSKKYPDAILNIYGEGPYETACHKLASINPNIIFHGYTDRPLEAIAQSEIFVLPSYYEGLSIALLEATMMQKATIATSVDGNPEVVIDHQTGLLVPPANVKKLADAMITLLDNPQVAQQMAVSARHHYEQNFDFSNNVKNQFITLIK